MKNPEASNIPRSDQEAIRLLIRATEDPALSANWVPLLNRVDENYGSDATLAESILDLLAPVPQTVQELEESPDCSDHKQLRAVLNLLKEDHYIREESSMCSWLHKPLQIIWVSRRRGL